MPLRMASRFPARFHPPSSRRNPLIPKGEPAPLAVPPRPPYLTPMNYVLALLLPPLSILIAGRPIVAIVTFLIWIPAIVFSGGLTHPMFILLAWILIYESGEARRARIGRGRGDG